jgi:hypothetical protein
VTPARGTAQRDDVAGVLSPARPGRDSVPGRRIGGLDVARGLAVLGMFGAHLGDTGDLGWDPATWRALADGRSSILFATMAGISIALLSGGRIRLGERELARARTRVLVRAAWVFAIGGVLELLGTFVAIILGVYAVLFVLALPFLRWPPVRLLLAAGVVAWPRRRSPSRSGSTPPRATRRAAPSRSCWSPATTRPRSGWPSCWSGWRSAGWTWERPGACGPGRRRDRPPRCWATSAAG